MRVEDRPPPIELRAVLHLQRVPASGHFGRTYEAAERLAVAFEEMRVACIRRVGLLRVVGDLSDDAGGRAGDNAVGRHVTVDHGVRAHDDVVTDRHTRTDNDICAEPAVVPNCYRLGIT